MGRMGVNMGSDYDVLLTTSIFSQDRRAIGRDIPATTRAADPVVVRAPVRTDAPIFRGVASDSTTTQAVLEVQEPNLDTGSIKYTALSCKPGETFEWNGSEYKVVAVSMDKGMSLLQPGAEQPIQIAMGNNIFNQHMGDLPDTPPYRSADATSQNTGYSSGRGRTRNTRGGTTGTPVSTGGTTAVTAAITPITAGSTSLSALQQALVSPAADPPLPPGSADDLERRMRSRRESQMAAPGGATTVSPTVITTPAAPAPAAPAGATADELERALRARRDSQMAAPAPAPAPGG